MADQQEMQKLIQMASTGLDLSPAHPIAAWAANQIEELRARIAQIEGEKRRLEVISDDRRKEILRLDAENHRLRADAEIASLKAERDSFRDFAHKANSAINELQTQRDLLKAALRWALENGVCAAHGFLWMNPTRFDSTIEPPPRFAALIAEAVESGKQGESNHGS